MRHRKSLAAEMMRKAAIKVCCGCACAHRIQELPVVIDPVPRLEEEERAVLEIALKWVETDQKDRTIQQRLVDAITVLRARQSSA